MKKTKDLLAYVPFVEVISIASILIDTHTGTGINVRGAVCAHRGATNPSRI
jgi:hypothetical protein